MPGIGGHLDSPAPAGFFYPVAFAVGEYEMAALDVPASTAGLPPVEAPRPPLA
jgi:hypothetical protein